MEYSEESKREQKRSKRKDKDYIKSAPVQEEIVPSQR